MCVCEWVGPLCFCSENQRAAALMGSARHWIIIELNLLFIFLYGVWNLVGIDPMRRSAVLLRRRAPPSLSKFCYKPSV